MGGRTVDYRAIAQAELRAMPGTGNSFPVEFTLGKRPAQVRANFRNAIDILAPPHKEQFDPKPETKVLKTRLVIRASSLKKQAKKK